MSLACDVQYDRMLMTFPRCCKHRRDEPPQSACSIEVAVDLGGGQLYIPSWNFPELQAMSIGHGK